MAPERLRSRVLSAFKLRGLLLRGEAIKYLTEALQSISEVELEDALEKIIDAVEKQPCWFEDQVFHVNAFGFPPTEPSSTTRAYYGNINFFGGPSNTSVKTSAKLKQLEDENKDAMFVFISDVWLDQVEVLEKLHTMFSGYSPAPPTCFILFGNFSSVPYGKNHVQALKDSLKTLADIICEYPNIHQRIQYCTQEIIVFREDLVNKMCRNCVRFPSSNLDIPNHFVKTVLSQGHLTPLPLYVCPVYWAYDYALRVYPVPSTLRRVPPTRPQIHLPWPLGKEPRGSMAKAAASSPLEDLDLSGEEVQQLTSAFQDPEFRRMFSEYAEEITDPENRRRYEEEITALERERGVEVRFVHPEPGHVLRTSLDGTRRCFVNVCSNALVCAPSSRPGSRGAASGSQWSLPYSLAPGREYAGGRGSRYTVYDVVFHPDALALARRHERFRQMLDATALEAVEKQFGVKLDRRNAKILKVKYKGTPEAAVLRTPLPEGSPARPDGEPESPLPDFPYPYRYPEAAGSAAIPRPQAPSPPEAVLQPAPTEPSYSVVQRHHVDLQDYRCSRDSAPSTVPQELVVTIELPLLRSAEQAALEVTGKLLCLDSRKPDYRLRLSLPYPVDDSCGKAQFNKARRQLVVTLPVALTATRPEPAATPEEAADRPGTDGAPCASAHQGQAGPVRVGGADGGSDPSRTGTADAGITTPDADGEERVSEPEERDFSGQERSTAGIREEPPPGAGNSPGDGGGGAPSTSSGDLDRGSSAGRVSARRTLGVEALEAREGTRREPADGAMGAPGTDRGEPLCPPFQCNQDEESLTLLIQVPRIQPQSLQGEVTPLWYKLSFSTQDLVYYSFFLQFTPGNKLNTKEPVVSISSNNAVIELAKSPECHGQWREWYYGLNNDSLE
ncbi:Protein kintoun, partial [Eschrichtius robustus]|nr:Protein kintoun [Eschrichtius robustus]